MKKVTQITFNKDSMTIADLKNCASTLDAILINFDKFQDDPEEFVARVLQYRSFYCTSKEAE